MVYEIEFHSQVDKDLDFIPKSDAKRIISVIRERLAGNPHKFGVPLKGKLHDLLKIRIGSYRIVYTIKENIVFVLVIAQRGKVYELARRRM